MKKKIFKILSVIMTLLIFVGIGVGVNAYSLDSNGNIVSANLCPDTNLFVGYINGNGVLSDTNQSDTLNTDYIYLTSGTYTVSSTLPRVQINWFSAPNSSSLVGGLAWNTFTFTLDNNYYVRIGINNQSETYYNGNTYLPSSFNLMLNSGSSALPYEPYGTWYSENNSQIKQSIGALANTNSIVVDLLENGEVYNSETYSNFFDLPFNTNNGQLSIPVNVFENWHEVEDDHTTGTIIFNYSNGIVPTNTYDTIYLIAWQYYTEFNITYYDGTSQNYQSTGESIQVTNPSNTYIKSITFETEYLSNYGPNITFALDNNYSSGYSNGYEKGYNTGYENGYNSGSTGKYQEGYNNGYNEGYEQGYEDNPEDKTLYNMVLAIADVPITLFTQIFNFDILGVNIAGFVTSLVSIAIIVWLVKFFI